MDNKIDIHKNLEAIKEGAFHMSEEHGLNYTILIHNPVDGKFDEERSTYEFVADTWFEKERAKHVVLYRTDDMIRVDGVLKKKNKMRKIGIVGTVAGSLMAQMDKLEAETRSPDDPYMITMRDTHLPYDDILYSHQSKKEREAKIESVRTEAKLGRNEPCHCGSGNKFKKCCK